MKSFTQHLKEAKKWDGDEMPKPPKDITKYSPSDLAKNSVHGSPKYVYAEFLYMDDTYHGVNSGNIKGPDGRIHDEHQKPTALYMTVIGPEPGGFLYPKGAYYVGHDRVNAVGDVVMGWAGTARLVTYDKKEAIQYIKKFGKASIQKKIIDKGSKGWNAWPPTYDLTGDFEGQGKGSKIKRIDSLDQAK